MMDSKRSECIYGYGTAVLSKVLSFGQPLESVLV